jgi:hypothetical protein
MRDLLITLAAAQSLIACAFIPARPFNERLDTFIGQRFADSELGKFPSEYLSLREAGADTRVYEYRWSNGCAFYLYVTVLSGRISGWKYASEPKLCLEMRSGQLGS